MSRSTSLLGARPPPRAAARAGDPVTRHASEGGIRTLSTFSHGPATHPSSVIPNNYGTHGYQGGVRTLSNLFNGASAHPTIRGINGYAARFFSTFRSTPAAAKTSNPTTPMPSVFAQRMDTSSVDSVRVKRTLTSSPSATVRLAASRLEWKANLEAARAAREAELAAWKAKMDADAAALNRFLSIIGFSLGFIFGRWISKSGSSSRDTISSCKGQSASQCCSSYGKCQCNGSNPKCSMK